ncbi:Rieske (2Fe-2S) protein [Defluviicoccus vanus]|uniref:Rieske 2Fe-2S domain-containing protein n=1 Tax=Defluviicoccus vanus TaxID=111831 RepID=A0A7H1MY95_9PROT|nr:hypothetical protein [Defluviicoccus vanus]QNT68431.1 hypothetical protein HQ394_02455 [Defluviicoccus vanus]
MPEQVIGQRSAIANGGSAALFLTRPDELLPLMAVRLDERVFVYVNSCPHLGWPLDFEPGQFLSHDRRYIPLQRPRRIVSHRGRAVHPWPLRWCSLDPSPGAYRRRRHRCCGRSCGRNHNDGFASTAGDRGGE